MNDHLPRTVERIEKFQSALQRLEEFIALLANNTHNKAYEIAVIGAFSFTWELAWKLLKDKLEEDGIATYTPREVVKHAFHANFIKDGEGWLAMLKDRNIISHVYDEQIADDTVVRITEHYISLFQALNKDLK